MKKKKKSSNLKSVQFLFQVAHVQNVNISVLPRTERNDSITQYLEFRVFKISRSTRSTESLETHILTTGGVAYQ